MSKNTRISKKVLAEFPPAVAEAIKATGDDYGVHSFRYESKPEGFVYNVGEGERIQVVYGDEKSKAIETVSENTLGASGLFHGIGAPVKLPQGAFLIVIWYYTRYGMTVYNIGQAALQERNNG